MEQALARLQRELRFDLEVLDVDGDPALEAKYDELVPVLEGDGKELCRCFLDESAVRAHLMNFR